MIIGATGIVVDHYGDVLLIQRDDTRTLAPPGGAAEIDELPPETAAREVREETGLIVMAVRLVGLYYVPTRPNDYLSLCFRCIMRGGEFTTSEESPRVGFFKTTPLPSPMLAIHRERIQRSLAHRGGPPYWGSNSLSTRLHLGNLFMNRIIYPWLHIRRRRAGLPPYTPPPSWRTHATAIIRDDQGRVLWIRSEGGVAWNLPSGTSAARETPWETAVRSVKTTTGLSIQLSDLSGVYPSQGSAQMTFAFEGETLKNPRSTDLAKTAFFASGKEPEDALPQHVAQVTDATQPGQEVHYRLLSNAIDMND